MALANLCTEHQNSSSAASIGIGLPPGHPQVCTVRDLPARGPQPYYSYVKLCKERVAVKRKVCGQLAKSVCGTRTSFAAKLLTVPDRVDW